MSKTNKVLVIEDQTITRRGIASFLAETGRWSLAGEAASLEEAMDFFEKLSHTGDTPPPDIVLLDLQLNDASGLDFIPWLREKTDGTAMPKIVVFSVYSDYGHIQASFRMGAQGYVCKNQQEEELEEAMNMVLQGNVYVNRNLIPAILRTTDLLNCFTKREADIFLLVQQGLDNRQIAEKLSISPRTVENNLSNIYDKTGVHSRKKLETL
jgi:NarL family two-component system response regulator LiaR